MVSDAEQLVKKCEKCQRVSNLIHVPSALLTHLIQPCPFAQWGIDILGPFPPATGQIKYLIAAIDYFTKWIEAEPLASITARKMKQFLWKNVICRFGIPRMIVSDNGTQFTDRIVKEWC